MKKTLLFSILLCMVAIVTNGQGGQPSGFPITNSTGWIKYGYIQNDSGRIDAKRDTNWLPSKVPTTVYWQNTGVDTAFWTFNGKAIGNQRWDKTSGSGGSGGNNDWSLLGNAATDASTNFLGTTDDVDVVFKRNGSEFMRGVNREIDVPNMYLGGAFDNDSTAIIYKYHPGFMTKIPFIHTYHKSGTNGDNMFSGLLSGNLNMTGSVSGNDGSLNTGYGSATLWNITTGFKNTAIGTYALQNNHDGFNNTGLGNAALINSVSSFNNTATGVRALGIGILTGTSNTANGVDANAFNTAGSFNVSMGIDANYKTTTGSYNTSLGDSTMWIQTIGAKNVALGSRAGYYLGDSDPNYGSVKDSMVTFLGADASRDNSIANTTVLKNMTVIGYGARGLASNQVILGNDNVTTTLLKGNVGAGTTTPSEKLDIVGNIKFSGALMPNNLPGTSGYILQSSGSSVAPVWIDPSTINVNIYNSDGTFNGDRSINGGGFGLLIDNTSYTAIFGGNSASSNHGLLSLTSSVQMISQLSSNKTSNVIANDVGTALTNKLLVSGFYNTNGTQYYYALMDSNHLKLKADTISLQTASTVGYVWTATNTTGGGAWQSPGSGGVMSIATSNGITGGTITTTGTISGIDALADGSTKGVSAYTASDFNSSAGLISIDYTNGQSSSTSQKGFLTSTDWNTFNGKQAALSGTGLLSFSGTTPSYNTTSASIFSIISDETGGSGVIVGNNTPTIITPSFTTGFTIGGSAASRKIIVGNGTNYVASTETWAVPGTSRNILISDGTNWTSTVLASGDIPNNAANTSGSAGTLLNTRTIWGQNFNGSANVTGDLTLGSGILTSGTLGYAATNPLATFQSNVNSFNQLIIQNTNSGATASSDMVVNNDVSTNTTFYGDFGMNSSGFSGSGAFNQPSYVFLTSTSSDLAIGTTTSNSIHFVVNNGATDAMTINSSGVISKGTWNGDIINQAYLGSGGGGSSKFLREDNTWQTVSGSGLTFAQTTALMIIRY